MRYQENGVRVAISETGDGYAVACGLYPLGESYLDHETLENWASHDAATLVDAEAIRDRALKRDPQIWEQGQ